MKPSAKKKYSCVILDDNPLSVSLLENIISDIAKLKLTSSFTDPIKAMAAFQEYEMIDFLFIDIGMEVSGLDIARMLKRKVNYIIFVTGHEKFAVKAFETGDAYLIKPIDFDVVLKTINKLISKKMHGGDLS
ncbi:LytR/AlgR family response regulator transcription factor [Pedobacter rhodius]|uniref:Response regulator n=1 Tax=Pedobacter rhodius TaxID=3004098 RepID=A0ABT4KUI2_9SPHI|nr:response regulator [Pedobacter sp. SJ11]MCZ4222605.1 response regulator [Pedobacter sp. SJ11]